MQHQLNKTYSDSPYRRRAAHVPPSHRRPRERAIRIHQKIFGGLVLLALLIAYDVALRIDEHVSYVTARHSSSLAFDDSAAAMHRF